MLGHKDAVKLFKLAETARPETDPRRRSDAARLGRSRSVDADSQGIRRHQAVPPDRDHAAGNPEYRAAAKLLSEGKTLEGFDALDRMGWVKEIGDADERYRHIAADYLQALDDKKPSWWSARRTPKRRSITDEIRSQLRAGRQARQRRIASSPAWSRPTPAKRSAGWPTTYRPGDVIQFHQNAKGFKKGDRLTVTDPAAVPLAEAGKFSALPA